MVCSSSSHISRGHWDMDVISNGVLSPRQGSWGQVPTQHQHAAPLHRWTVDAGPKRIEEDLHRPGTVRPSPRGSGEGLEHHRLHEGSVHRKRLKSDNVCKTLEPAAACMKIPETERAAALSGQLE